MKQTEEEKKRAHIQYLDHCRSEVEWYRQHGQYPDRVSLDSIGTAYVIGDYSWNNKHPDRQERAEPAMLRALRYGGFSDRSKN